MLDSIADTNSLLTHQITLDQTKLSDLSLSLPASAVKKCAFDIEHHVIDNAYTASTHQ